MRLAPLAQSANMPVRLKRESVRFVQSENIPILLVRAFALIVFRAVRRLLRALKSPLSALPALQVNTVPTGVRAPGAQRGLRLLFLVQLLVQTAPFVQQDLTPLPQALRLARCAQLIDTPLTQTLLLVSRKFELL